MANIIHIRKDETPHADQDWVLLERTPWGGTQASDPLQTRKARPSTLF